MMVSSNPSFNNPLNNFCIAGVNYHKSDMSIRSKFSLSESQILLFLNEAKLNGFAGCLVLSTCNRTEVYSICPDPQKLIGMICSSTQTTINDFLEYGYIYQGISAVEHLFNVAAGLDSQIIGDYEILAQLKQATNVARQVGCINTLMERVINYALQASKEIKTKTKLSSGIVSVSYAAIEIIKEKIKDLRNKKFLLAGAGKFGKNVAKNIKSYLPESGICFSNRTDEKARVLANIYEADFIPYENLPSACNDADIIIVSSAAEFYTILPAFFITDKPRLILDLSVPLNVDPSVKSLPGLTLLNVDEVSAILDKTISIRQAEVPGALRIINETLDELITWCNNQLNNSFLRTFKSQLFQLNEIYFVETLREEKVNQAVSLLAVQLKHKTNKGCQCINALNSYLQMDALYDCREKCGLLA